MVGAVCRSNILGVVFVVLVSGCSGSVDEPALRDAGDGDDDGYVAEDSDASTDEERDGSTPAACSGSTVAELCTEACEAMCQGQELFCVASQCLPDDCSEGGDIFEACAACDTVECARNVCDDMQERACATFGVENDGVFESLCLNSDPSCLVAPELGCADVCGSAEGGVGGDLVQNGVCEDGREDSVASTCDRGTDCSDCGPHVCAGAGSACSSHGDCCGFGGEVGALCVDPDGQGGSEGPICFPACDETHECPDGFRCNPTTGEVDVCVES